MAGIYLHIPFCKQACHYCDFHFSTSLKRKDELLQALNKELILRKAELQEPVATIYFGGGTPSLLTSDELQNLINTIYKNYKVIDKPEITIEANPDDLTEVNLNDLAKTQINRLSIGVQSFFDVDLQFMNRAHSAKEAKISLKQATTLFDNISIDLIYGIPGSTNKSWLENIQTAMAFEINHISSYALTVEPNTALASFIKKGKIKPLDDQLAKMQFEILIKEAEAAGFEHYEISNFAKPKAISKHNTSYWQGKAYLGIGPSAHSYNGQSRSWNVSNNIKYIKAINQDELPSSNETLSLKDKYNELIMIGLRTKWGISLIRVENDFGSKYKAYLLEQAKKHIDHGSLYLKDKTLFISKKAKFLADGIAADLFMI